MAITLDADKGITFPTWTTLTRPVSPSVGQSGFNTTLGYLETYSGSAWVSFNNAGNIIASGVSISGATSGSVSFAVPSVAGTSTLTFPAVTGNILTDKTAGAVLQVVQTVKTDSMASTASAVWANVPGQGGSGTFNATITPKSTSNKILIMVDMKGSGAQDSSVMRSRLLRDATAIYVGDASSNRPRSMGQFYIASGGATGGYYLAQLGGTFLDSPATTSAVTYTMQFGADGTTQTVYINRTQGDRDNAYYDSRVPASITLMEIAA